MTTINLDRDGRQVIVDGQYRPIYSLPAILDGLLQTAEGVVCDRRIPTGRIYTDCKSTDP